MFDFPSLPGLDELHPVIVHFPIALLLIAPFLLIIGLMTKKCPECFLRGAALMMTAGTIFAILAAVTGEAASEIIDKTPEVIAILKQHEEVAEFTRNYFIVLTLAYLSILFLPQVLKKEIGRKLNLVLMIAILIAYAFGALSLLNTGSLGGKLVHGTEKGKTGETKKHQPSMKFNNHPEFNE